MDFPENMSVYKDGKCYTCTLRLRPVRGGKRVLYIADDGSVIKEETLARYKERLNKLGDDFKNYMVNA